MVAHAPRRWLNFSLRMMFVVITLIGGYLGYHANTVHARRRLRHDFYEHPAVSFSTNYRSDRKPLATIPWIRRFMGDQPIQAIYFHRYNGRVSLEEEQRLQQAFPEAEIGEVTFHPAVPDSPETIP